MSPLDFHNYQEYLGKTLDSGRVRGRRAQLARAINCQASFVSQVLTKKAHFTEEQALKVAQHLNLTRTERDYFLLLVKKERSGTKGLRQYYHEKLHELRQKRQAVRERIANAETLQVDDHSTMYYSNWYYSAIHVLTGLKNYQSPVAISKKLDLPQSVIDSALDILVALGLVRKTGDRYQISQKRIHIDSSPLANCYHSHWRNRSIRQLDHSKIDELHFSAVLALSNDDAIKVKQLLLDAIANSERILANTNEEEAFVFTSDFYQL